jgi:hypothetical protein
METDNDDNSPRTETVVEHACNRRFKLLQFLIDGHAQCLKDARGRMAPRRFAAPPESRPESRPVSRLRWRSAPADCVGQIAGGANRLAGTTFDDIPGDSATVRFFPVPLEDLRQRRFIEPRDELCSRFSPPRVESQIERSV